ncbi:MAG TPA: hypothetical protein VG826_15175 [Pirellulales bacterium]|nr:hypothetical protein [Pirellulales bacterium]
MAEHYTHTLIAKPKDFVPSANQVQQFISDMVTKGVVPLPVKITGRTATGETRTMPNPFGGKPVVHEIQIPVKIDGLDRIFSAVAHLSDYNVMVSGFGQPQLPPVPIEFSDAYGVSLSCRVSSTLRSTSNLHDESSGIPLPFFGKPCDIGFDMGFFTNPHTGETIKVPDAGCARLWIEVELGKFLFPQITNDNLALLNPAIVADACRAFGIEFVQGCFWG